MLHRLALLIIIVLFALITSCSGGGGLDDTAVTKVTNITLTPANPAPGEEVAVYLEIDDPFGRPMVIPGDKPCPDVSVTKGQLLANTVSADNTRLEVSTGQTLQVYGWAFCWTMPYGTSTASLNAQCSGDGKTLNVALPRDQAEYIENLWIEPSDPEPGDTVEIHLQFFSSNPYPQAVGMDTPRLDYSVDAGTLQVEDEPGVSLVEDQHISCRCSNSVEWTLPAEGDFAGLTVQIAGVDNKLKVRFKQFNWTEAQERSRD